LALLAGVVPGARLLLLDGAPAALLLSRIDVSRPSVAWLAVALLAADLILEARVVRATPSPPGASAPAPS
ncbi:MAG: hypothetical protein ACSLFP_14470, partial [Acidimicrobiales bacterium]